jgi:hypothetical protein
MRGEALCGGADRRTQPSGMGCLVDGFGYVPGYVADLPHLFPTHRVAGTKAPITFDRRPRVDTSLPQRRPAARSNLSNKRSLVWLRYQRLPVVLVSLRDSLDAFAHAHR